MPRRRSILVFISLLLPLVVNGVDRSAQAAGTTYYVDCANGADSNNGRSTGAPWRSLGKANSAPIGAGDSLRLKRNCTWNGQRLDVTWVGTSSNPVTVGTYGSGSRPQIRNGSNSGVFISGKHVHITGLSVDFDVFTSDPCGQPLGSYYGFNITNGGSHITLQDSVARHGTAGLHVSRTAGGNHRILNNSFLQNNVMTAPFDGSGDLGAWGILLRGDNSEIAYNLFQDNTAVCIKGTPRYHSNSIELYEARNNHIHHNTSINDRVFSELGSSSTQTATGNRFTFNVHVSDMVDARFITTRGALDNAYGPVNATVAERNSIHYTGAGSQGLLCILGCTPSILTARYNIIHVVEKTIYFDNSMGQVKNLLWSSGEVMIQDGGSLRPLEPGTDNSRFLVADPKFVSGTETLTLRSTSPAIDRGGDIGIGTDHSGGPAVIGDGGDIGANEYSDGSTVTTTPSGTTPATTQPPGTPTTTTLPPRPPCESSAPVGDVRKVERPANVLCPARRWT